jgi:hypothetical protein
MQKACERSLCHRNVDEKIHGMLALEIPLPRLQSAVAAARQQARQARSIAASAFKILYPIRTQHISNDAYSITMVVLYILSVLITESGPALLFVCLHLCTLYRTLFQKQNKKGSKGTMPCLLDLNKLADKGKRVVSRGCSR